VETVDFTNPQRILVECALAGAAHGVRSQLEPMLDALPLLIEDAVDLAVARGFLLIALGRHDDALGCVEGWTDPRVGVLVTMVEEIRLQERCPTQQPRYPNVSWRKK
jgi:type III secretion system SsaH family protein